jgi:hypothetical protein
MIVNCAYLKLRISTVIVLTFPTDSAPAVGSEPETTSESVTLLEAVSSVAMLVVVDVLLRKLEESANKQTIARYDRCGGLSSRELKQLPARGPHYAHYRVQTNTIETFISEDYRIIRLECKSKNRT